MRSDACCARSGSEYQCKPGDLHVSLPCDGGTLRIGLFQDGTGNKMTDPDRYSNVAKLARVYRIDKENREIRWAYARGVGTNPDLTHDLLGQAIGTGGPQRLNGLLHAIQVLIADYEKQTGALPSRIVLDCFGFSRGSALIRHLVNCIKQGHFELDEPYRSSIPKDAFKIGFLGVFDSVGSFGMPGDNKDKGYTFHVPLHWLEDGGLHLVADDEHRANFDLQAMLQADDYPQDRTDGKFREVVLPGAHSDVGGGYPSSPAHAQNNNELARIALQAMYDGAREKSVPLDITGTQSAVEERKRWKINLDLQKEYDRLIDCYQKSHRLRPAHRRWRVTRLAEDLAMRDLEQRNVGNSDQQARQKERERECLGEIRAELKRIQKEIRACFAGLWEYDDFMDHARKFYDNWVHRSHNPYNSTPGMQAERRGKYREQCQREVFINGSVDMTKDKQFKKLAPRPFKDGVWIDEDCIAQFQG